MLKMTKIQKIKQYIIRVYGLVINERNQVLISDEYQFDMQMTKFPGGGLEFGEGAADCIKREAIEEFGQEIDILSHFYTTDFFQQALFFPDAQLVSIYYRIRFKEPIRFKISEVPFDFKELKNGKQSFRWENIHDLTPAEFTFPIDRIVAEKLQR